MLPRSIDIGPLTIHLYGLIIAVAVFAGWYLAKKRSSIYRIPKTIFDNPILIVPMALAIIGARVYHVLDLWSYYNTNPIQILAIQNGGLGIWGGLLGAFVGFWLVAKVKKLNLLSILDLAAPSILLGQSIGRIGNFINQEAFGPPTDLPWAVYINFENRPVQFVSSTHFHPTFFYEAALDFIFFIILLYLSKKSIVKGQMSLVDRQRDLVNGQLFALYLIFYSTGRFIVEFWRIDTWVIGEIKIAHILAIATFVLGTWLFVRLKKIGVDIT